MVTLARNRHFRHSPVRSITAARVREVLLERSEIALLDLRDEAVYAEGHPLFAANLPLSRIELDVYARLPRDTVPIVLLDNGESYAEIAAERLTNLGYSDVSILKNGLRGWIEAEYEIFRDVNSASKAFGELVESVRRTPSLSALEVQKLIEERADILIADARRYEEFHTMSIPGAISVPGGELVFRLLATALKPSTRVIVNCAGRTRSILGTQSLINAGLPNPICALRNGTMGWKLAGLCLEHGAMAILPAPDSISREQAAAARHVADAAGVRRISLTEVGEWRSAGQRTVYLFDVRGPIEYSAGHIRGFCNAPGGQLVQETDVFAPVRGARIVLADNDGARANMTASWLAQMNWEVYVLDGLSAEDFDVQKETRELPELPEVPPSSPVSAETLHQWLQQEAPERQETVVLDFSCSRDYMKSHIPRACFALRSRMEEALAAISAGSRYVVTSFDEAASRLAWKEVSTLAKTPVYLLEGGTNAWHSAGHPLDDSEPFFASRPLDCYRRPYEGTGALPAAMQGYLDWEAGLVEQLKRDNTHGFWVLREQALAVRVIIYLPNQLHRQMMGVCRESPQSLEPDEANPSKQYL